MSEASSETIAIPVPPGFIELTGAFGAATILLHHSQVGEVADRRGAHGTPRPTLVRHRTQRRKWEVEQSAAIEGLKESAQRTPVAAKGSPPPPSPP